jgi:DNA-binding CsgD family transcriptional regulator
MTDGYHSLTDKEKQTLRLILCGHDAKSMAGELELSVHTVNERLRNARRKLAVTSSKEAARVLLEAEGEAPEISGYKGLGDAEQALILPDRVQPDNGPMAGMSPVAIFGGLSIMSLLAVTLAFLLPLPDSAFTPGSNSETAATSQSEAEAEAAARDWLELVDAGNAEASYAHTAHAFRALNTLETWQRVMGSVRTPLGETLSRRLVAVQSPDRPEGYTDVVFETVFANRTGAASETATLAQVDGEWRVVGIVLE